jgi:diacylglycerol kinase family enzyme
MSGDYLLVEVMNFGCAGPNLCLVPDAVHADGLFDIVVADVSHRAQMIDELPLYRRGRHPASPLPVYSASHVVMNAPEFRLHLDDELRACSGSVELTVEPGALTFLV